MDSYIFILNMYLHSKLQNRSKPIRIGFIGCGKFVSMFLAQYNQLEKIQIDSIVDVDTEKAKKNCLNSGLNEKTISNINFTNSIDNTLERDIEIVPGSTVTINSNGDSDRFATVHRMRTLGSMIGERINIQNSGSRQTQFTISGTLHDGDSDTEVITVSAGGTTSGSKYFKTVTDIKANLNPNGNVIIGKSTSIGSNTTIDRAVFDSTTVGEYSNIDNLVQIAHNVNIGDYAAIAAQVGIAGSTKIGNYVKIGGQAGISGHLIIGDNVTIAGKSGVTKNIADNSIIAGFPAKDIKLWKKEIIKNSVRK